MSNVRYSNTVLGSGTVPFVMGQPTPSQEGVLTHQDGANAVIVNPENFSLYRGGNTRQIDIAGTATRLDTGLVYRRTLALKNMSTATDIFLGFNSSVTTLTGFPLSGKEPISIDMTNLLGVWAISAGSTVRVAVMEIS